MQDTFVTGFEQLAHAARAGGAVRAWLGQIAVSLVAAPHSSPQLARLRRPRSRGRRRDARGARRSRDVGPDQKVELRLVDRLLGRMRTELRIAWMLRRVEGLELAEVASMCGCSLATAKRRIAEADESSRGVTPVSLEVQP